jgi:hypothetical protein
MCIYFNIVRLLALQVQLCFEFGTEPDCWTQTLWISHLCRNLHSNLRDLVPNME